MTGTDHFSSVAKSYAEARPTYPAALFEALSGLCREHDLVWDAGCGNGQASLALAGHFHQVVATDLSASQIASAAPHPKINYRVAEAQASGLEAQSADLITVAQALHWFDLDAFYAEVRRVAKPKGVIAVWTYGLFEIEDEAVMAAGMRLYEGIVGPYWPAERIHPETGYARLAFPFARIELPRFYMEVEWTLDQLLGFFRSWSATARYQKATGKDPVAQIEPELRAAWDDTGQPRRIVWPMTVLAGLVHG